VSDSNIDSHGGLDRFEASHYGGSQSNCNKDGCTLGRTEAEIAYEALMSGLPEPGWTFRVPHNANPWVTPTQDTFNRVLRAIRPSDEYAIKPKAAIWRDLADGVLTQIESDLRNATSTLGNSWVGDDFDALEDSMDTTLTNLGRTRKKMIDLADELDEAASNLETYQALQSGETPFPPAGFNLIIDEECCDSYILHVRPPWHSGNCERFEGGDAIAEVLVSEGASFAQETRQKIETDAQNLVEHGGWVDDGTVDNTMVYGP
jgi:uncharacterized protein YukE